MQQRPASLERTRALNDYAALKRIVTAERLLDEQPAYYAAKTAVALLTLAASVAVALLSPWRALVLADAVFMAFATTQVALLAHDVGHAQAFRGARTNRWARLLFGNLFLGVSHSWWTTKHNQHHATPNHLEKDPDIQFPFLVFSPERAAMFPRRLRRLLAGQAFVLLVLLPFQSVHMRVQSVVHLGTGKAPRAALEAAFMLAHFALYAWFLSLLGSWQTAVVFLAIHQAAFGLYNSSVFASNHKGMLLLRDANPGDFLREQVLTARDVTGRGLTDFWYGGLNYQIEHHLFPTMPRNRLARAQEIVRPYCAGLGLQYHATTLPGAFREGFMFLHRTGRRGAQWRPGQAEQS